MQFMYIILVKEWRIPRNKTILMQYTTKLLYKLQTHTCMLAPGEQKPEVRNTEVSLKDVSLLWVKSNSFYITGHCNYVHY